jgi:hypothetical protein
VTLTLTRQTKYRANSSLAEAFVSNGDGDMLPSEEKQAGNPTRYHTRFGLIMEKVS